MYLTINNIWLVLEIKWSFPFAKIPLYRAEMHFSLLVFAVTFKAQYFVKNGILSLEHV